MFCYNSLLTFVESIKTFMTKKVVFFIIATFYTIAANSQSFTYYPFNSFVSLASNPNRTLWLDAKFQTNSYFSSLSTEISPTINLNNNPLARYYIGAGTKFNFLNLVQNNDAFEGYFLNIGVRSAPFKYKGIQIAFELSPYANKKFDLGLFRANLGIGYNFSHKRGK